MPEQKYTILLAEDDPNLGQVLAEYLEMKGFEVVLHRDGEAAWEGYRLQPPDLCILDVMLPKQDGFTLAREIRSIDQQTPLIFLTAKNLMQDRIEGLMIGADDYLTKPFSMQELLLRIHAILRRTQGGTLQKHAPDAPIQIGRFKLQPSTRKLSWPDGALTLTNKEAQLLYLLARYLNKTLPRSLALEQIWGGNTYYNARSMDVYVAKLRKILKRDEGLRILTVHGEGFKLVDVT